MNLRLRDEIEEYVPFDEAEEKIKKYLKQRPKTGVAEDYGV